MKLQPCERNFSVRRADAEKPGCLIFKNLTKTTSSHSKPKEPSDNFIPTPRYLTDSTYMFT